MEELRYLAVRMGLRAPRVAMVVPGDDHWDYWVKLGLHVATHRWGGAGFVLVPHDDGRVHPLLLQAVQAYDPDYVVLLEITLAQHEEVDPGCVPLKLDGRLLEGHERDELIQEVGQRVVNDPAGRAARDLVAGACSPHRRRREAEDSWDEDVTRLGVQGQDRRLTITSAIPGTPHGPALSSPVDWAAPLGVATAARCGVVDHPVFGREPALEEDAERRLVQWLLDPEGELGEPAWELVWHPAAATSVVPSDLPSAFDATAHGLSRVQRSGISANTTVIVAGDTASDFALALAWDRLYGRSIWLASDWWPSADGTAVSTAALALQAVIDRVLYSGGDVRVTSTSLREPELAPLLASLRDPPIRALDDDGEETDLYSTGVSADPVEFPTGGRTHLAVADQFDQQLALPMQSDGRGGFAMMTPPPPPTIRDPDLAKAVTLSWQVDLEMLPDPTPRGRGIDGHALVAADENPYLTWIRSGRDGITYEPHRYDFVPAGTPQESRLARPRLRRLDLFQWLEVMAAQSGFRARRSAAGRRAQILERLWGSRTSLVDTMAGPMLAVLRAFHTDASSTDSAYPLGMGVVLAGEGYLSFAGMAAQLQDSDLQHIRREVDELIRARVFRRGLVLGCGDCGRPAFIAVDDLGQVNRCQRCGSENELIQDRWRHPDEPAWFYDLHPAVRELLEQNGHTPLVLSHYLRKKARRFADISEIELTKDDTDRRVAEADLVASIDGRVVVGEATTTDRIGKNESEERAARKRMLLALTTRADEIVLATTTDAWSTATVNAMSDAMATQQWPAGRMPALRLITSLGSQGVEDDAVVLPSG